VRAEIKPANGAADITVRDNTQGGALYALDSGTFAPDSATVTRDLHAASGWGGTSYTGTRAAGPFAILDAAYLGQKKIAEADSTRVLPPLKMFWSVNNRPAEGDLGAGDIGTSFYWVNGAGEHVLYILGQQDVDTDEYDSHVVAHEFGHFVTAAVSRDDSIGGSHGLGNRLDPRVAFSEGFANGWAGMVTDNAVYSDTMGTRQAAGFAINLGTAPVGMDRGWYSEATVQYLAWTTYAQAGSFSPIYTALTAMASAPAPNTIYTFAAALPAATPINLGAVNITGTGPYGTGETNNGGNALNLPVYKDHPAGTVQTYCLRTDAGTDGNKLGNTLFLKFSLTAGSHTVSVSRNAAQSTAPDAGMDPDFMLVTPAGARYVALNEGSSDSLVRTFAAGTHTLALHDYFFAGSAQRCYDITVN
jgi:hypothetical protein